MVLDYSAILWIIAILVGAVVVQSAILYLSGRIFKVENIRFLSSLYVIIISSVLGFVVNFAFNSISQLRFMSSNINGMIFMLLLSVVVIFLITLFLVALFFKVTKLKAAGISLLYFILCVIIVTVSDKIFAYWLSYYY
ncbi:hypothetical protein [Orbus mooreae]|uniref:hypothetical protein n=1 Tax=Orbus mooreae TaxID=3074107 RepID=UPI00370D6980